MNTENNKLIAEFLGKKTYVRDTDGYSKPLSVFNQKELNFDTDWDWLMKAVEKIEILEGNIETKSYWSPFKETTFHNTTIKIFKHTRIHSAFTVEEIKTIYSDSKSSKIESIYEAVVNFIKFYNKK